MVLPCTMLHCFSVRRIDCFHQVLGVIFPLKVFSDAKINLVSKEFYRCYPARPGIFQQNSLSTV